MQADSKRDLGSIRGGLSRDLLKAGDSRSPRRASSAHLVSPKMERGKKGLKGSEQRKIPNHSNL